MLRLKQIRAEKGLTQEQVAERSGLSRSYICALDSGDREPSVAALRRLADALGVQPGELLTEVPHDEEGGVNRTEPDHYELGFVSVAAARKNSTVSYFRSEWVDGGFIVTGAEITGTITRGPRKGKARYSKDTVRVIVTKAEVDAECDRYESETGCCSNCLGTGQQFASWHVETGIRTKLCERCRGNGAAKGRAA